MLEAKLAIITATIILMVFSAIASAGADPVKLRVYVQPQERNDQYYDGNTYPQNRDGGTYNSPYYGDDGTYYNDDLGYYNRDGGRYSDSDREALREHQRQERREMRERENFDNHQRNGMHFDIGK